MSRYPSAYGHTPSYRSVGGMSAPVYPSALAKDNLDREFSSLSSGIGLSARDTMGLGLSSRDPLLSGSHSSSSSTCKTSSYSSTTKSSSLDGGVPHRESHYDSTYKSTRQGDSGIPHTSYSHNSSSFSTDRPYKNQVSSFSYNI